MATCKHLVFSSYYYQDWCWLKNATQWKQKIISIYNISVAFSDIEHYLCLMWSKYKKSFYMRINIFISCMRARCCIKFVLCKKFFFFTLALKWTLHTWSSSAVTRGGGGATVQSCLPRKWLSFTFRSDLTSSERSQLDGRRQATREVLPGRYYLLHVGIYKLFHLLSSPGEEVADWMRTWQRQPRLGPSEGLDVNSVASRSSCISSYSMMCVRDTYCVLPVFFRCNHDLWSYADCQFERGWAPPALVSI